MSFRTSPSINHVGPLVKEIFGNFNKFFLPILASSFLSPFVTNSYVFLHFYSIFSLSCSAFPIFCSFWKEPSLSFFSNNPGPLIAYLPAHSVFVSGSTCKSAN